MTSVDVWAACAASIAASAIAIRAHMLRPHQAAWTVAPAPVWMALSVLALSLAMAAVSLWFGAHASPREALVYTAIAVAGLAMLWNLNRNGRMREAEAQRVRDEVDAHIKASGEPGTYWFERRNG